MRAQPAVHRVDANGSPGSLVGRLSSAALRPPVAIFVDLSNIFLGARTAAESREEPVPLVRLQADRLLDLLADGREISRAAVVANADVPRDVAARFEREFSDWIPREAGRRTGTEQANDETLQVRMYEAIHSLPPGVLVLATGDGAGWRERRGFVAAIDTAWREGWGVEVAAWPQTLNPAIREWLAGHHGALIDLDDHYYSIAFVEDGRRTQPVLRSHRPAADDGVRPGACTCNTRSVRLK